MPVNAKDCWTKVGGCVDKDKENCDDEDGRRGEPIREVEIHCTGTCVPGCSLKYCCRSVLWD